MKKLIGLYYGDRKISKIEELKDKTYLGNKRIRLIFEGKEKTEIDLPLDIAQKVTSIESLDATKLVKARIEAVMENTMVLFTEAELTIEEINYMMPYISESININIDKANKLLWGKDKGEKTLLDVDHILLDKKYDKTNTKHKGKTRNRVNPK